jgi:hypothetical protein
MTGQVSAEMSRQIKQLPFTKWLPWSRRAHLPGTKYPGVYMIGHFATPPQGNPDPSSEEIIYIGQTTKGSLAGRWSKFDKSARTGRFGHSGGRNYHSFFAPTDLDKAYVSAIVVSNLVGDELGAYLLYLERMLIWAYTSKWHKLPPANKE